MALKEIFIGTLGKRQKAFLLRHNERGNLIHTIQHTDSSFSFLAASSEDVFYFRVILADVSPNPRTTPNTPEHSHVAESASLSSARMMLDGLMVTRGASLGKVVLWEVPQFLWMNAVSLWANCFLPSPCSTDWTASIETSYPKPRRLWLTHKYPGLISEWESGQLSLGCCECLRILLCSFLLQLVLWYFIPTVDGTTLTEEI